MLDNLYTRVYSGYTDTDQEVPMETLELAKEITAEEVRPGDWITIVTMVEVDGEPVVTNRNLVMVEACSVTATAGGEIFHVEGPMNDGGLSREYGHDSIDVAMTSHILIKLIGRDGKVLGF